MDGHTRKKAGSTCIVGVNQVFMRKRPHFLSAPSVFLGNFLSKEYCYRSLTLGVSSHRRGTSPPFVGSLHCLLTALKKYKSKSNDVGTSIRVDPGSIGTGSGPWTSHGIRQNAEGVRTCPAVGCLKPAARETRETSSLSEVRRSTTEKTIAGPGPTIGPRGLP